RLVPRASISGRPGVQGIAFDAVAKRAIVSSVGALPAGTVESRLPGSVPLKSPRAVPTVQSIGAGAQTDEWTTPKRWAGQLGDYMAGAVAIAPQARAGASR